MEQRPTHDRINKRRCAEAAPAGTGSGRPCSAASRPAEAGSGGARTADVSPADIPPANVPPANVPPADVLPVEAGGDHPARVDAAPQATHPATIRPTSEPLPTGSAAAVPAIAVAAAIVWQRFLRFDPADPGWPDRDRFVLSSGRFAPLLARLLDHAGVRPPPPGCSPGRHPALETEAGPPGQGFATAVGLAMAERVLAGRFGRTLVDHRTWVMACETDLAAGVSLEAAELAGRMELGKLVVLFEPSNDGRQDGTQNAPDAATRFAASGWAVRQMDATDPDAVAAAINRALRNRRPTLIACLSGASSPPMPADNGPAWAADNSPAWAAAGQRGAVNRRGWLKRLARHRMAAAFERQMTGRLPPGWHRTVMQAQDPATPAPNTLAAARQDLMALRTVLAETVTLHSIAGAAIGPADADRLAAARGPVDAEEGAGGASASPFATRPGAGGRLPAPASDGSAANQEWPGHPTGMTTSSSDANREAHGMATAPTAVPASAPAAVGGLSWQAPERDASASEPHRAATPDRADALSLPGGPSARAARMQPLRTGTAAGNGLLPPAPTGGRHLFCGVQEHGMAAISNGLALHGGLRPILAASVVSIDRMRPALRLAALMQQPVVYLLADQTSGEAGWPPMEQFASLRAMPHVALFRPADPVELAACWELALHRDEGPSLLSLSDRTVAPRTANWLQWSTGAGATEGEASRRHEGCAQGGYVLAEADRRRQATLIATGPEVATALAARAILWRMGIETAVVSLPCWELFGTRTASYHAQVLGRAPRIGIEAASGFGWERWLGQDGVFIGMDGFGPGRHTDRSTGERGSGADRPGGVAGITADRISTRVCRLLGAADV